ncbi:MAG: cyclase family protein [Nanoarchaeota archaeon]
MDYIDISSKINDKTTIWPEGKELEISFYKNILKDGVYSSLVKMDSHTGTHLDAPKHFIKNGMSVDHIPLSKCVGKVYVVDIKNKEINKQTIYSISDCLSKNDKIIFKTKNTELDDKEFYEDYVALDISGAKEISKYELDLIGIDYLSIQKYGEEYNEVHRILLKNNILILEGLNLKNVDEGKYKLYAFPLNIENLEASPVRAVLEKGD